MKNPHLIRNIAIVGNLHHGKTALLDCLTQWTHPFIDAHLEKNQRYTDPHQLERLRGLSLKSQPMSLLLPDEQEKTWLFNLVDTPGHVSFVDEVLAGMVHLADGCVVVVDCVEGVMAGTEQVVKLALKQKIPMTLLVNKMERLIMELKLPLNDAYFKLRHTIEEVNALVRTAAPGQPQRYFAPENGNVCFSSTQYGWCFSLESFAKLYAKKHSTGNSCVC